MQKKTNIWLVDTSVFLNILDVPGRNQNREEVLSEFKQRIERGDTFLLPYAAVIETGNFVAQLNGNHKLIFAKKFVEQVRQAINGEAPWKLMRLPTSEDILVWLDNFPASAGKGIGFADFSMIQEKRATEALRRIRGTDLVFGRPLAGVLTLLLILLPPLPSVVHRNKGGSFLEITSS